MADPKGTQRALEAQDRWTLGVNYFRRFTVRKRNDQGDLVPRSLVGVSAFVADVRGQRGTPWPQADVRVGPDLTRGGLAAGALLIVMPKAALELDRTGPFSTVLWTVKGISGGQELPLANVTLTVAPSAF